METLETATCDENCSGIINNPKEVFLFGCNTLASKEVDRRTPEQYRQVLLNDGFSEEQAQQVAAFRYSDLGTSFKGRMAQIFTQTPRIYGFSSVGPSGKTIEPYLEVYLNKSKGEYLDFDQYNKKLNTNLNQKFMSPLRDSAVAQATGFSLLARQSSERPYCYSANDSVKIKDKLNYIKSTLVQGRGLTIINYIQNFLSELKTKNYVFSEEEEVILNDLKNNSKVKEDFKKLYTLEGDVYLKVRTDVLTLMLDLKFIDEDKYIQEAQKTMNLDLQKNINLSVEKIDLICSLGMKIDLRPQFISEENKKNWILYKLLGCLKSKNIETQRMAADAMENDKTDSTRMWAMEFLGEIKTQNSELQERIVQRLKNEPNKFNRAAIIRVLSRIQPGSLRNLQAIANSITSDKEEYVQIAAVRALWKIKAQNFEIHRLIAQVMKTNANSKLRYEAAYALGEIKVEDAGIREMIKSTAQTDTIASVRDVAARALIKIEKKK